MLVSAWRPVCPECGYSIRGLTGSVCPECGSEFPTASKTYRRWAYRRIAWDRKRRGSIVIAYLRTLAVIVCMPWRAARGLVIPDRWGRCVRWACVHVVIVAFIGASLAHGQHFRYWVQEQIAPSAYDPPHLESVRDVPAKHALTWFGQSLAAWGTAVALPVGLGALLSMFLPGRHRAAKWGGVKWSLYLSSLLAALFAVWLGCYYWTFALRRTGEFPLLVTHIVPLPTRAVQIVVVGTYGIWWAAGMVVNPFNRKRGFVEFVRFAVLFVGVWMVMAYVLFPAGAVSSLL